MPWNDDELSAETNLITEQLEAINKRGVLTINSQPNVNGAPSSDIKVGWGSPNGYIYQKVSLGPYLDFFFTRGIILTAYYRILITVAKNKRSLKFITCTSVDTYYV